MIRLGVLLVLTAAAAAAQTPARDAEKQAALGAQLFDQIRQSTTPIDRQEITDYVAGLGQKLAAQLPGPARSFTFTVVADDLGGPTHEPLVLPAGYIFVPAGLILAARDETELAGMLARAIVQPTQVERPGTSGVRAFLPAPLPGATVPEGMTETLRSVERQADKGAVPLMAAAGYDPAGLIGYLQRLDLQPDRIERLQQAARQLPTSSYTAGNDFTSIQDQLRSAAPAAPSLLHP